MPPWLRTCAIVLALGWPIGLHLAAVSGHEGWMPAITAIAAIGAVGVWVATKGTSSAIVAARAASRLRVLLTEDHGDAERSPPG